MEFGDLSGLYNSIDEQAQKMEDSEMLTSKTLIEPNEWDYHNAHISTIEKFMKSDAFRKLTPQEQSIFLRHRSIHQQFLRSEMQAAANMQPGAPDQAQPGQGGPVA